MSALDAVHVVLEAAGAPLHYEEITRRALDGGHWKTQGKTPDATVNAQLAVDIKKHGAESRFQRTGHGVFALRKWGLPEVAPKMSGAKPAPRPPEPALPAPKPVPAAPPEKTPAPTLSFTDAAVHVLEHHGKKQPMHYRAITDRVLALGLVHTEGQTPEATLYAQILTEIKRKVKRGDTPRFVKHGKGYVGLQKWMSRGLAFQIERHNAEVRTKLLDQLRSMDPAAFEALVGKLLVAIGFEDVVVTRKSADGGIDVRATLVVGDVVRTRMAVQVKRWKNNVQSPTVQQVRGSLGAHEQGLIINTGGFSNGARDEAERRDATPVGLMDGEQFVRLLIEHDIGVRRNTYDLIELGSLDENEVEA